MNSVEDDGWSMRPAYRVQPMPYETLVPVFNEPVPMIPQRLPQSSLGQGVGDLADREPRLPLPLEGLEERPRLVVRHDSVRGEVENEVVFSS